MSDAELPPTFHLNPRLQSDTAPIGDWPLGRLLLMNDARYPWVILVPRRAEVREIHDLDAADRHVLLNESVQLGRTLMQVFSGHKLNVAALGNVVPQLHLHHIVRYESDDAWPAPVWGRLPALPYAPDALRKRLDLLREHLTPAPVVQEN